MTISPGRILASLAVVAAVTGISADAQTITSLGIVGNSCASIPQTNGTQNHVVTLTSAVPAGRLVVVNVGTAANIPLVDPISDTPGNSYPGEVARFSNPIITKSYAQVITNPLGIGNTITIGYTRDGTGGTVTSCAVVTAYTNVTWSIGTSFSASDGSSGATSTALASGPLTTTDQLNYLFVAAIATDTPTGTLSSFNGFTQITPECSGGLCINPFFRIVHATGTYQATATAQNAVIWAGTLAAYKDTTLPVELQTFEVQ